MHKFFSVLYQFHLNLASPSTDPLSEEAIQLARGIREFQKDTSYSKKSRIKPGLQERLDYILSNFEPGNPLPRKLPKRKTRTAKATASPFYSDSSLTDKASFQQAISHFEALTLRFSQTLSVLAPSTPTTMDSAIHPAVEQAITSATADLSHKQDALADKQDALAANLSSLRELLETLVKTKQTPSTSGTELLPTSAPGIPSNTASPSSASPTAACVAPER